MKRKLFRARLACHIIGYNLARLLSSEISPGRFLYAVKKQMLISSLLENAKCSKVGDRYFLDPFAPFFPGPFFNRMLENNSVDCYPLKPNHAQISITNLCPCRCFHCHVKNTQDEGKDLPKEKIFEAIDDIVASGFHVIFFVGGEPFSRFDDLVEFVRRARTGIDTRIWTSGVGADGGRLRLLREAGLEGICVSLDHHDEHIHNSQRCNRTAFRSACAAIRESSSLGMYTSAVCCVTSTMVKSGDIFKTVDFAESLGAHSIQINEIRPVGRANEGKDDTIFLAGEDKRILIDYYKAQNRSRRKMAIVMPWYNEEPDRFGCMATSGQNVYIDSEGNVQPCVLLKAAIGNILEQGFTAIWDEFVSRCRHPVRECIVHTLGDIINDSPVIPLPKTRTLEAWQQVVAMDPTDMFKRIAVRESREH